jgi:hypothetical protein
MLCLLLVGRRMKRKKKKRKQREVTGDFFPPGLEPDMPFWLLGAIKG